MIRLVYTPNGKGGSSIVAVNVHLAKLLAKPVNFQEELREKDWQVWFPKKERKVVGTNRPVYANADL